MTDARNQQAIEDAFVEEARRRHRQRQVRTGLGVGAGLVLALVIFYFILDGMGSGNFESLSPTEGATEQSQQEAAE